MYLLTNLRSLDDFVMFERVEVVLDMNCSPLDNAGPEERVSDWRLEAAS
jgi:hypothetical protein